MHRAKNTNERSRGSLPVDIDSSSCELNENVNDDVRVNVNEMCLKVPWHRLRPMDEEYYRTSALACVATNV